ncbi:MAG: CHASE2 domain-containing protein, partial [Verrucomicrobiales bacterium]|nr:CHASE2 domain-containing protein [Verrucomicrobiales bacterium]
MEKLRRIWKAASGVPWKFLVGILAMGIAALCLGAFQHVDRYFYDAMLHLQPRDNGGSGRFVIIKQGDPEVRFEDQDWERHLSFLRSSEAAAIVFESVPDESPAFFQAARSDLDGDLPPVIFGQSTVLLPNSPGELEVKPLPEAAQALKSSLHLSPSYLDTELLEGGDGIWRWHRGMVPLTASDRFLGLSGKVPLLETRVAAVLFDRMAVRKRALPTKVYGVRYWKENGSYRHFRLERLVEGDIPQRMLEGRIVLIANDPDPVAHRIPTPFHRGTDVIDGHEFRAAATDSLLNGDFLVPASAGVRVAAAILVFLLVITLFSVFRNVSCFLLTASVLVQIVSGCWLAFHLANFWIPPTELLFLVSGLGIIERIQRENFRNMALRQLFVDTYDRIHENHEAQTFLVQANPWPHVEQLLKQAFPVKELVILEVAGEEDQAGNLELVYVSEDGQKLGEEIESRRLSTGANPFRGAMTSDGAE